MPDLATNLLLPLLRLGAWLVLLGVVFVPLEWLAMRGRPQARRRGRVTDIAYFFVNGLVPGMAIALPLSTANWIGHRVLPADLTATLAVSPLPLRLGLTLLLAEFGFYWGHRLSHEVPLLWRFHAVHHSPTQLDWLVTVRGHPADFIFTRLCGLLPVAFLGLAEPLRGHAGSVTLLLILLGPSWGFFIHADVPWRFGILERLIATPAFHHWHHTDDGPGLGNRNYAPLFPWVDHLFGTLHLPRRALPNRYGTTTEVGASLAGQLLSPLLPPATRDRMISAARSEGSEPLARNAAKA